MTLVSQDRSLHPELASALLGYVMDSGRLVVVEVDRDGVILDANVAFRSRFAGFANVRGEPLSRFLRSGGQRPDIEPGLPNRQPVARIFKTIMGGESYLFHAYPLSENALLIGERAGADDNDIIARMGNLTLEMSRLVRDLRKANHDLEQANRLNERLARTDALTQLPNRRYFMERLSQVVAQARTRSHPLSVLMMDLDHFKRVNDTFGHAAGDRVLIAFAELMRAEVRLSDLPGRLGGEEFGLYMFDVELEAALSVAERLRTHVNLMRPLEANYQPSVSIGVAALTPDEDIEQLLKRADDGLYRAKESGRNRVMAAA
ncbi:GGDEF domain-containing protein [Allochromatium palmeri]|uniref:diguanylate cyclase n=1 Tax=Allochromatium palmeri TaxID=231048 RepID=A0A6N8ECY0_9GAMM|nr:GGDEF domain-containing protein [Allochromatium palmeri]MTW20377.1 diguanylate cyclase [Allochromatium palmeri]